MRRSLWTSVLAALVASFSGCDNGRDRLLAELQSTRAEDRALAVKKLAEQSKSEDLVLFTRAAKDQAAVVRSEAVVALGKSQDSRVVDLLGELLGDPDDAVQARAALALAEIKNDKSRAYLTMQYSRRGRSTRQAIVQALQTSGVAHAMSSVVAAESKTLWERNLKALNEGSLPEKVAAAEEIGKSGRPEAVTLLTPLLEDSQVILAAAAVRGLGYAGDRRSVQPISQLLTENYPQLREAACESLLKLSDPAALPKLRDVAIERSAASPLATAAIIALPRSPESDKALCDVTLSAAPAEATQAGHEMRHRGGCPLEPILKKLAAPPAPPPPDDDAEAAPSPRASETQSAALQAIIALGPTAKDALPKVLPLLTSSQAHTRRMAIQAIAEIGEASAIDAVQKTYERELKTLEPLRAHWIAAPLPLVYAPGFDPNDPGSQPMTPDAQLLKSRQSDLLKRVHELNEAKLKAQGKVVAEARPPREIVDDVSDGQLRPLAAAIRALGVLKAPGALETLKKHLDDPSLAVRRASYEGLAALGPEGIAAAQPGLFEADRDLQSSVALALADQGEAGQRAVLEALGRLSGEKLPLLGALERPGSLSAPAVLANEKTLEAIVAQGGAEATLAARVLGDARVTGATETLLKSLDDPDNVARRDTLVALGKLGDARAAQALAKDLYNDGPDVRSAAADGLAMIGKGSQGEALEALKGDYYRRVRESAQTALAHLAANPEPPNR